MKRFVLAVLLLALFVFEGYSIIETKFQHDYARAQEISEEIQATILDISASLRNGEQEKYEQAKEKLAIEIADFGKFASESNLYNELEKYKAWLDSEETNNLLQLNAKVSSYNSQAAQAKDTKAQLEALKSLQSELDFSPTSKEDLIKIIKIAERLEKCASYCLAEDYEKIRQDFTKQHEKMVNGWGKLNEEYSARFQAEALIERLESY